ncbi:MAG: DNA polymerase IV [Acidobacteriota bacterium]
MDAFYASVEQRDRPELRGKPVVVAWEGERSVVCAASYEARRFGIRSAMPALRARRLCAEAVFVAPDFERYRAVSRAIREIFLRHTPLVEPLSLDEAYLDVTEERTGLPTATAAAQAIRREIRDETRLTASAGVAPNKFLAKIASDWKKPDGLFVIKPHQVASFLAPLPVGRLPGVGKATESALAERGIATVGDLRRFARGELRAAYGRFGERLYELCRGIDERPVVVDSPRKSISSETTFARDLPLAELDEALAAQAREAWAATAQRACLARTVTVKLKTADFRTLTRRLSLPGAIGSEAETLRTARQLVQRFGEPEGTLFRLIGVGLSNFLDEETEQGRLFVDPAG